MRLDKFLKVSRIIKRRTVAKEFADNERVMINGRVARASAEVKKGDVITIQAGNRKTLYEVLDIVDNIKATEAANLYRIIE
jgi:ribosomal 50S subunit-recycling heat shock protein